MTAAQRIAPGPAVEHVAPIATEQGVVTISAATAFRKPVKDDHVVEVRAADGLYVDQRIGAAVAVVGRALRETDIDAAGGPMIGRLVKAKEAGQDVVAAASFQTIISVAALQLVVAASPIR